MLEHGHLERCSAFCKVNIPELLVYLQGAYSTSKFPQWLLKKSIDLCSDGQVCKLDLIYKSLGVSVDSVHYWPCFVDVFAQNDALDYSSVM